MADLAAQEWCTSDEVAERLRVRVESVRRWTRDGVLKGTRFGRGYRYAAADVEEFMRHGTVDAAKAARGERSTGRVHRDR